MIGRRDLREGRKGMRQTRKDLVEADCEEGKETVVGREDLK